VEEEEAKKRAEQIIRMVDLDAHRDYLAKELSSGLRKRLGIGLSLIRSGEIYLLDEPFNGLDAESVQRVQQAITFLREKGRILFVASHVYYAIQPVCTQVVELDKGLMRKVTTRAGTDQRIEELAGQFSLKKQLRELYWIE
jgi:ABC-type multidrug transport system ATPase subunit